MTDQRIDTTIIKNRAAPQKNAYTVTNSAWVKIADQKALKGVDREFFTIAVRGEDPAVRILLSDEPDVAENVALPVAQGIVLLNELRYFECDWYAKVEGLGADTDVTVWVSNPDVF